MLPGWLIVFTGRHNDGVQIAGALLLLFASLGLTIYQCVLLTSQGQTLGKKIMGIRIVRWEDGGNPGFVGAFLMRAFVPGLIYAVPLLGFLFWLTDCSYIFRDDRRCIHDLMAGTKVVVA